MLTKVEHQAEAIGFPQKLKEGKKKKEKVTKFIEILFGIFEVSHYLHLNSNNDLGFTITGRV